MVTLYVQFLCSDWSKFDRWVHAQNLCSILKLIYFDSWSWQSFVSTCDVFNCLFPLDVQMKYSCYRVYYSWLVCLLNFCLRNALLGIVFVFHLAACLRGLKSLKRFWPYLIAFRSCISNRLAHKSSFWARSATVSAKREVLPQTRKPSKRLWESLHLEW